MPRALLAPGVLLACTYLLAAAAAGQDSPPAQAQPTQAQSTPPMSPAHPETPPPKSFWSWLDFSALPFIPVPEIDADPYAGTTLGLIGVYLINNEQQQIKQIFAPDVIYNSNFGYGMRGRVFSYPSDDTQWSVVGGGKQRIESEFDAEYAAGRTRRDHWSFNASVIYDRSGSPRYYGVGNDTTVADATNYTAQQKLLETVVGFNFTPAWQLGWLSRLREVDITPGHLSGIPSIEVLYPETVIRAQRTEWVNRLYFSYDSRNDLTIPTSGMNWVVYAGGASPTEDINASLYTEVGTDWREYWSLSSNGVLAAHIGLRYMPHTSHTTEIPFWALSGIGGDESVVGSDQTLRGFGPERFRDRDSFALNLEYRRQVFSLNALNTRVGIELAPFFDAGRVFHSSSTNPLSGLHKVIGLGFRGIASPNVVGYVDVGHGDEGTVVFSGLNYPF